MGEDSSDMERAADSAARDKRASKKAAEIQAQKRLAGAMLTLLPLRDQEVLSWICDVHGKPPGQILTEMIRVSLVKERRTYREAHGGGGASSTDLDYLTERLPRR